jgi:pimeloyl-ACP methyl ester carboxylesterase
LRLENVVLPGRAHDLSALRYLPDRNQRNTAVVLAHGFTSGKYSMDNLASYLAMRGYEALTFDFVGHKLGGSGGTMESMAQAPGNLRDALFWLRGVTDAERIVLIGHSMGAAAALVAAAWEAADLASPALIGKIAANQTPGPPLAGVVCLCMGTEPSRGFDTTIGQAMLEQRQDYVSGAPALQLLREIDGLVASAAQIGSLPVLFIAAKQDVLVSVERVERLAAMTQNGSVQVIDSSHLEAPDRARAAIYSWLSRL